MKKVVVFTLLCTLSLCVFAQGKQGSTPNYLSYYNGSYKSYYWEFAPLLSLDELELGSDYKFIENDDGSYTIELSESCKNKVLERCFLLYEQTIVGETIQNNLVPSDKYEETGIDKEKLEQAKKQALEQYIATANDNENSRALSMKYLQDIFDTIYTSVCNTLKLKYDFLTTGKENRVSDSYDIEHILQGNTNDGIEAKTGNNYLMWILFTLLLFEILIIGITTFVKSNTMPLHELLMKLLQCVLIMFFVTNIWTFTDIASKVFVKGANVASNIKENQIDNKTNTYDLYPSEVLEQYIKSEKALTKAERILEHDSQKANFNKIGFVDWSWIVRFIVFILSKIILFIIYVITAIYVMLWQIELRVLVIIAAFLIPFRIFRYTDFLSKGILQTILGQCVKIFTATFIIRISPRVFSTALDKLNEYANITSYNFTFMFCGYLPGVIIIATILCYFTLKAPETARALLVGQPTTDGNIQGMATRLGTKGVLIPFAATRSFYGGALNKAMLISGAKQGRKDRYGEHLGRSYAFQHGGIGGYMSYMAFKKLTGNWGYNSSKPTPVKSGIDHSTPNPDVNAVDGGKNE